MMHTTCLVPEIFFSSYLYKYSLDHIHHLRVMLFRVSAGVPGARLQTNMSTVL